MKISEINFHPRILRRRKERESLNKNQISLLFYESIWNHFCEKAVKHLRAFGMEFTDIDFPVGRRMLRQQHQFYGIMVIFHEIFMVLILPLLVFWFFSAHIYRMNGINPREIKAQHKYAKRIYNILGGYLHIGMLFASDWWSSSFSLIFMKDDYRYITVVGELLF